jgi:uncharacterized protein
MTQDTTHDRTQGRAQDAAHDATHDRAQGRAQDAGQNPEQNPESDPEQFAREWEAWHLHHEGIMADRHGFLAITNIHWLGPDPRRFDDVPGAWSTGPKGVCVTLAEGEELIVDGEARAGGHSFGVIPERGSVRASWGDNVVEVAKRGGYDLVRPRHPDNPLRRAYRGTPAYPPDPRWALPGRFTAFAEPRPTRVGAAVEGLEHVYHAVGQVEVSVGGADLALTAFPGPRAGELLVLFTDATSGVTTYAANRSVVVGPVAQDGSLIVDFNRAVNLPCAYTDLATCPLPPPENRMPVAVEAGEMIPFERLADAVPQTAPPAVPVHWQIPVA